MISWYYIVCTSLHIKSYITRSVSKWYTNNIYNISSEGFVSNAVSFGLFIIFSMLYCPICIFRFSSWDYICVHTGAKCDISQTFPSTQSIVAIVDPYHCCKTFVRTHTVYPKQYAHGFVVLYFVVVMQSFIMISHEVFIHIHQCCFAGTGAIVRLPQCQWSMFSDQVIDR